MAATQILHNTPAQNSCWRLAESRLWLSIILSSPSSNYTHTERAGHWKAEAEGILSSQRASQPSARPSETTVKLCATHAWGFFTAIQNEEIPFTARFQLKSSHLDGQALNNLPLCHFSCFTSTRADNSADVSKVLLYSGLNGSTRAWARQRSYSEALL